MKLHPKLSLLTVALAAGCALSPQANQQLEEARAAYRLAASDPEVQLRAQPELQSAANALTDAERMAREGKAPELIEHNAYLAERRARIALRTAETRKAQASIQAERDAAAARAQVRQAEIARQEAEARASALRLEIELADVRAKQTERGSGAP